MNKIYADPEIEIIFFVSECIITTSDGMYSNDEENEDSGDFGGLFGGQ